MKSIDLLRVTCRALATSLIAILAACCVKPSEMAAIHRQADATRPLLAATTTGERCPIPDLTLC